MMTSFDIYQWKAVRVGSFVRLLFPVVIVARESYHCTEAVRRLEAVAEFKCKLIDLV